MNPIKQSATKTRTAAGLAAMFLSSLVAGISQGATVIYYSGGTTGTGAQTTYMPTNSISGTMVASVPGFNPVLGTLIQADFEFASSVTGSWTSTGNPGISSLNLSGPADVGGQPMGNLVVGFTGPYNNMGPSNDYNANSAFLTVTSGPFFNSLTGAPSVPLSYMYSGSSTMSEPAIGIGFAWGGSAHVLYTYEPVPEPSTLALGGAGLFGLLAAARKWRRRKTGA